MDARPLLGSTGLNNGVAARVGRAEPVAVTAARARRAIGTRAATDGKVPATDGDATTFRPAGNDETGVEEDMTDEIEIAAPSSESEASRRRLSVTGDVASGDNNVDPNAAAANAEVAMNAESTAAGTRPRTTAADATGRSRCEPCRRKPTAPEADAPALADARGVESRGAEEANSAEVGCCCGWGWGVNHGKHFSVANGTLGCV